jgi:para-nitrobenzyl esterase
MTARLKTDPTPVVQTSCGKVRGFVDAQSDQCRFSGIPYAEPPVGALRFRKTVPKTPWDGILDATRFGPASPQVFDPTEGDWAEFSDDPPPPRGWVGAEDSLTLNIWTPAPDARARPVIVWIHGGANWLESSRLATYHGDNFVARGDVVFVSFNYRLGVFGWLDVSGLGGPDYAHSHSSGLYDQITALRWIKANIARFGGDPDNITVMGESAGSMDTSWLLANGQLEGLARRVVLMSGINALTGLSGDLKTGSDPAYAREKAAAFLKKLSVSSMEQLLALPTAEVMERVTAAARTSDILFDMDSLFWARKTPGFTPEDPLRSPRSQGIDVMIGYTAYEMGLWLTWDEELDRHPFSYAADRVLDLTAPLRTDAAALYARCFPQETEGVRGMHLLGDSIFAMPSLWFADALAAQGEKVWMYRFDRPSDPRRGALHAADQTYLFGKSGTRAGQHLLGHAADAREREAREKLTAAMQDAVLAFARAGDPNAHGNAGLPRWPRYDTQTRAAMLFDTECRIAQDPEKERRLWWREKVYGPAFGEEG